MIVYTKPYGDVQKLFTTQFPEIKSILFNKGDAQKFASQALEISQSHNRFKKIANLNPNQKLEFASRPRDDIKKIFLLLEPDQYKSVLPAFRYHGGEKFQYINFISALESLNNVKQLLDFENSLVPISTYLSIGIPKQRNSFSRSGDTEIYVKRLVVDRNYEASRDPVCRYCWHDWYLRI